MRVLIVDDEKSPREALRNILAECCPDVEIVGLADSVQRAYELALTTQPDLVLLDISMPPSDGFALLKMFGRIPFEVVFTTAYSQYAIQAIKFSAADYLLKPVDPEELEKAIEKVRIRLAQQLQQQQQAGQHRQFRKISLPTDRSMMLVSPDDIIRAEVVGRRLQICLKGKPLLEITRNLAEIEPLLSGFGFFRAHRAHLINLNEIREYMPDKNGGFVVMSDNKLVPIASRRKEEFESLLGR